MAAISVRDWTILFMVSMLGWTLGCKNENMQPCPQESYSTLFISQRFPSPQSASREVPGLLMLLSQHEN
jgi:hypothetical protein